MHVPGEERKSAAPSPAAAVHADEVKAAAADKFSALITDLGGAVSTVDKWGMRKFAYPINYKTEGYYVLMNFESAPEVPAELERQMRNDENVVRFLVTRK